MFFAKTPAFLPFFLPAYTWRVPTAEKILYLSFDDGPIPEMTPWVLETLGEFGGKATFFCVGDNVRKHPAIFQQVLHQGHAVGNHTFHHLNGWKTGTTAYLGDVAECHQQFPSKLFRPPYGRLKPQQAKVLAKEFRIVMWDVLSGDFSQKLSGDTCFENVEKNARPGSIVVFHDSLKAARNLRFVLPKVLTHFSRLGYRFEALPS